MIGDYSHPCSDCGKLLTGNWLIQKVLLFFGLFLAGFLSNIFWILAIISVFVGNEPPGNCGCTIQRWNDK